MDLEMHSYGLSEEQILMRQTCRDFVDDIVIPFVRRDPTREWNFDPDARLPPEILEGAHAIGLRTLGIPAQYGGLDVDPESEAQTFAIIASEIARGDSGLADKLVQNWKVSIILRHYAPPHLQDEWFPRIVDDPGFLLAHCLTEPRGASDRWLPYNVPEANMDTKAVFENRRWVLNGRKQFISNGWDAKLFVVYANTNPKVGILQGTSSFLVPRDTQGFAVVKCNETIGGRYMNNGEMVLEECRLPEDHLLVRDEALGKAGVYFRPGKIIQGAKNLGVGVAAFDDTVHFVHEHVQGGAPLIKHQAVALRLADMAIRLETVRALMMHAARAVDLKSADAEVLCHMLKVHAAESILEVCKHAMELHGGTGAMLEAGIEKYFRDAAIFPHMDGTHDVSSFKVVKGLFPQTAGIYAGSR